MAGQPSGGGGYDISGAISNATSQFFSGQTSNTDSSLNVNGYGQLSNSNPWPMVLLILGIAVAILAVFRKKN